MRPLGGRNVRRRKRPFGTTNEHSNKRAASEREPKLTSDHSLCLEIFSKHQLRHSTEKPVMRARGFPSKAHRGGCPGRRGRRSTENHPGRGRRGEGGPGPQAEGRGGHSEGDGQRARPPHPRLWGTAAVGGGLRVSRGVGHIPEDWREGFGR